MPFKMDSLNQKMLESLIYEKGANCFALQGIDEKTLARLKKAFESFDYHWITTPYSFEKNASFYMFAYDVSKMAVLNEERYDFIESECAFEASAQVFTLHTFEDDKRYCVANTHAQLTSTAPLLARQKQMRPSSETIMVGYNNAIDTKAPEPQQPKNVFDPFPWQIDAYSGTNTKPLPFGPIILMAILRGEELLSRSILNLERLSQNALSSAMIDHLE
ncbi:MAG TPA: hypothetical protein DDY37_00130 [Legionella sp.]|nr:hypothetical protein [Legionella sp.]